jgi:class 3 adenylate cyclase/pimeloyl-ACP methyl ester carboxylesterase
MNEPRIQYTKTSDGVNIAYATAGEGRCVIAVPPPVSHAQRVCEMFPELFQGLAQRFRAIWYDSRGFGLSDRSALDFSMAAMVRDLEAVANRAGGAKFVLWAVAYDAASIAISYAARRPNNVSHLILVDGRAGHSDYLQSPTIGAETALRGQDWVLYTETFAKVLLGFEEPAFAAAFADYIRASVEPEAFWAAMSALAEPDWEVSALLGEIRIPTLVLHNRGNRFLPVQVGQRIASSIPDARFLVIDDMLYAEVPRLIESFISETTGDIKSKAQRLPSGTAIILFADIVDSTALTETMGDAPFRKKARDLDGLLRAIITESDGQTIEGKLLGDGVLAVFSSARQAIEAAVRCGKAGNDAGLPLHLGINAGDVLHETDPDGRANVYGGAVNIASRISGLSAPGEVLVSETVRSLARTSSGVRFEDRGERELKGIGEAVRVWAVRADP